MVVERKNLKNKPLVEAIFEMRWKLKEQSGMRLDSNYKLLPGRLSDKLRKVYPYYQILPTEIVPEELAGGLVQHQFRKSKNQWPLVQIGPGILTVNDTENYIWKDFRKSIIDAVKAFYEAYPDSSDLIIESLLLRYIDGIEFDFDNKDILQFLKEQMKISITLPPPVFEKGDTKKLSRLNCVFSFKCDVPESLVTIRLSRGKFNRWNNERSIKEGLLWDTVVDTRYGERLKNISVLSEWLEAAHDITHKWFFKIIEGDLEKRFQ